MKEIREAIHQATLTKTQKKIADYVLDHPGEACFMTSTELAEALGTSEASMIRFSRSLGYAGFMDFQKALRKDYQEKVESISGTISVPSERFAKSTSSRSSAEHFRLGFETALSNLENVFKNNAAEELERAADLIIKSKNKYIAATRGNACLGDYFFLYLTQMVPGVVNTSATSGSAMDHMCYVNEKDCLIVFSFPRYSSVDETTVKMAYEAKTPIIVITDRASAELAEYATILIVAAVDSQTYFNSFIGPQFVTESLLTLISHRAGNPKEMQQRLNRIDKYLSELGNF